VRALKRIWIVPVVLVLCASCATLSPERRYLGEWSGTHEGETYTALFDENNRCILTEEDGGTDAFVGNWTLENEEITVTVGEQTLHGFITTDGGLVLSEGSESIVLRKVK